MFPIELSVKSKPPTIFTQPQNTERVQEGAQKTHDSNRERKPPRLQSRTNRSPFIPIFFPRRTFFSGSPQRGYFQICPPKKRCRIQLPTQLMIFSNSFFFESLSQLLRSGLDSWILEKKKNFSFVCGGVYEKGGVRVVEMTSFRGEKTGVLQEMKKNLVWGMNGFPFSFSG